MLSKPWTESSRAAHPSLPNLRRLNESEKARTTNADDGCQNRQDVSRRSPRTNLGKGLCHRHFDLRSQDRCKPHAALASEAGRLGERHLRVGTNAT